MLTLGVCRRPAPLASCAYNDSDANLLAVGQTVGQPTRTVRDMSDLAHAPDATLAAVHGQRFCPDTEEVTGSNPVSPTKKALVSHPFSPLGARLALERLTCRPNCRLSLDVAIEELGDRARPACNNWTQFLPVHALGDARASIADQMCDLLDGHPELHERQRSGAPHANPARRRTRGECHQRARLGGIKPSRTTLKLESRDEDLAKAVRSGGRRKGAGPKGRWP